MRARRLWSWALGRHTHTQGCSVAACRETAARSAAGCSGVCVRSQPTWVAADGGRGWARAEHLVAWRGQEGRQVCRQACCSGDVRAGAVWRVPEGGGISRNITPWQVVGGWALVCCCLPRAAATAVRRARSELFVPCCRRRLVVVVAVAASCRQCGVRVCLCVCVRVCACAESVFVFDVVVVPLSCGGALLGCVAGMALSPPPALHARRRACRRRRVMLLCAAARVRLSRQSARRSPCFLLWGGEIAFQQFARKQAAGPGGAS